MPLDLGTQTLTLPHGEQTEEVGVGKPEPDEQVHELTGVPSQVLQVQDAGDPASDAPGTLAGLSALLMATDRDEQVVGCALTVPPGRFLAQVRPANEVQGLALMLVITKLKGLAVDPAHRGRGIGAALVKRSVQLYEQSGFHVMYGQFTAERDLEPFYRRQRFTVLDTGNYSPFRDGRIAELDSEEVTTTELAQRLLRP